MASVVADFFIDTTIVDAKTTAFVRYPPREQAFPLEPPDDTTIP